MDANNDIPRNPSSSRFRVEPIQGDERSDEQAVAVAGSDLAETFVDASDSSPRLTVDNADRDAPMSAAPKSPKPRGFNVKFTVGKAEQDETNSTVSSDHQSTYEKDRGKSFRHVMTVDKAPHYDHYRNLSSITGTFQERSRPTLQELHDEEREGLASAAFMDPIDDNEPDEKNPAPLQQYEKPHQKKSMTGGSPADIELALSKESSPETTEVSSPKPDAKPQQAAVKFGWIRGVLIRCVLNILGVMLFLRLSWVSAQAGIGFGALIVLISTVVTVLTSLSMSAICTNGLVKGGGAYFMISRSLGPEFGGAIGLMFAFANSVGVAMYVVGFSETVRQLLLDNGVTFIDGATNDVRVIGMVTLVLILGITLAGSDWEAKAQIVLLILLGIAMIDYIIGTFIVTDEKKAWGIHEYRASTFKENFFPAYTASNNFFSVFSIFFPAATGILAGANISGDLSDPQRAIPLGTMVAIAVTTVIYVFFIILVGATVDRSASGVLGVACTSAASLLNGTATTAPTAATVMVSFLNATSTAVPETPPYCPPPKVDGCCYGSYNTPAIIEYQSAFAPLVTAGIFAASLSSALASLVSAPKVFQAVCKDRIFPYLHVFAKGYGPSDEPRRAYALAFIIAAAVVQLGELDAIAPIISNFFLACYGLINYAVFDASLANSPGFRPTFRFYNMWLSLLSALLCIFVMFIISWWTALLTFGFIAALYIYIHHRKPDVNWGSSAQAHSYRNALTGMLRLMRTEDHVKNYRPQILALTGNVLSRPSLVDFVSNITKDNSLLICGHVLVTSQPVHNRAALLHKVARHSETWLRKRKVKAFYIPINAPNLRDGARQLMEMSGLGKLRPNIVLLGYKSDWKECAIEAVDEYVNVVHDCFDLNLSLCVLRTRQGLDFSELMREHELPGFAAEVDEVAVSGGSTAAQSGESTPSASRHQVTAAASVQAIAQAASGDELTQLLPDKESEPNNNANVDGTNNVPPAPVGSTSPSGNTATFRRLSRAQKQLVASINEFQRRIKKGIIDVYWLFDDGGLTLLLPYLLSNHKSYLEGAKLRVFTVATSHRFIEQERSSMAALLSKFRIDFVDVTAIPDVTKKPSHATICEFEQLIKAYRVDDSNDDVIVQQGMISETELLAQKDKTYRQLRIRELVLQNSCEASLIIMTLPIPRKGSVSAALYMSWLEMLTRDLPPTLLVRGNQQAVLTYYS